MKQSSRITTSKHAATKQVPMRNARRLALGLFTLAAFLLSVHVIQAVEHPAKHADHPMQAPAEKVVADKKLPLPLPLAYPLDTCPITGGKLGAMGKPVVKKYDGREVQFCCAGCLPSFEKDLKASLAKLDKAIVAKQKPRYPLTTCLVTGEKLIDDKSKQGPMGKPIDYVYNNQLVRLCCKGCIKTLEKEPHKYFKVLAAAYKKQASEMWTCPMHKEIMQAKPGKCPKCGMNLSRAPKPVAGKK